MARDALDKRTRVLVVEDIESTRNTYARNLELEGDYRVDMAGDLPEALAALDICTYQVALVDIMLAGAKDTANRDGVKVLARIQDLAEGTQSVVLSAQGETQLVREFIKKYEAFDYLDKDSLNKAGIEEMFEYVAGAAQASPVGEEPSWSTVVDCLAGGREEPMFVSEVMDRLSFSGGFENLNRTLRAALRHLLPLLAPADGAPGLAFDEERQGFTARYWSKGQGCAIELGLYGKRSGDGGASGDDVLFEREKGKLRVVATRLAAPRPAFGVTDRQ